MTQPYPAALVIASLESVSHDNNVLYRLVRPLADGSGVESTDRLVNVVPHRRTYCFERKEQFDTFSDEILRRPLVIQPVLHFGRGLGPSCGACYNDEPWVVMINQTHPKILGRLQMGLELARSAVARGQSVEVKFRFGKLIERVYREHLEQKESGDAESKSGLKRTWARALLPFRFVEWDHGDLTLRSHGLAAKFKTSTRLMLEMGNIDKTWDFEDVGMHDMLWSEWQSDNVYPCPNLAPVSEDEIRAVLPGWTINAVTPLEAIGEAAPSRSYSYAQAGRLYASFRKTRNTRNVHSYQNSPAGAEINNDYPFKQTQGTEAMSENWDPQGAEAMPENWAPQGAEALPAHWAPQGAEAMPRDLYPMESEENWRSYSEESHGYNSIMSQRDHGQNHYEHSKSTKRFEDTRDQKERYTSGLPHADSYGHIVPQVYIKQPGQTLDSLHHLKKQDSDRSSRSTNADSGYCPGTDDGGQRSRGGSYDLNDDMAHSKGFTSPSPVSYKYHSRSNDDLRSHSPQGHYLSNGHGMEGGLENPAFAMSVEKDLDSTTALQNHREFVKKVLAEGTNVKSSTTPSDKHLAVVTSPSRQLHHSSGSTSSLNKIAESFI